MSAKHSKYVIIGAGLSGLTTAYFLKKNGITDVRILEGRSQIGGRIFERHSIDFGATWFQQSHQYVEGLLEELQISSFQQYQKGQSVLVYNPIAPAHYFKATPGHSTAKRIAGGSIALINKLAQDIGDKIELRTKVETITEVNHHIEISSNKGVFTANKVIITIPPQLASTLSYQPALPKGLIKAMHQTHTWMSNAIKVGMTFSSPFWREKNYSGMIMGNTSAVTEIYDHCNYDENVYSLMGFVNEELRTANSEDRKERILGYLEKYLGKPIRNYTNYFEKDWSQDAFTNRQKINAFDSHPNYGHHLFDEVYMHGKVVFSGTETAKHYGGYLEGAVISGLTVAKQILSRHKSEI